MAEFSNSDHLYQVLKTLFGRMAAFAPGAAQPDGHPRLVIRLRCTQPEASVVINGRKLPPEITYGATPLRPDLDVELTADALHRILLADLPLRKALSSGQMKVRGQILKTHALEFVLHQGQAVYPQIAREMGLNGRSSG